MKPFEEVKMDLYDAITLIEGLMDINHYSDSEIQDMHNTISGIQQAINTIDEQLIDGTLPTQDEDKLYKQFLNLNKI
jgi:hypothetical protein